MAGRSFQLTGQTRTFTIPRLLAVESVHTFLDEIISFDFVAILILLSLIFPFFFIRMQWISKFIDTIIINITKKGKHRN